MNRRPNPQPLILLWTALLMVACYGLAQEAPQASFTVKEEPDVKVTMRDGVRLSTNIYRPDADGKFSVLLMRTPYGNGGKGNRDAHFFAQRGYAVVIQDTRGISESEGMFDAFQPEATDGYDTQQWVGEQTWSFEMTKPYSVSISSISNKRDSILMTLPLIEQDRAMGWRISFLRDWLSHPEHDLYWTGTSVGEDYSNISASVYNIGGWYDILLAGTIDLWATSNVFMEGHQIRVEISSSNFPRFDRNLNTGNYFATDTTMITAEQTIYHSLEHPSHIILPVINQ